MPAAYRQCETSTISCHNFVKSLIHEWWLIMRHWGFSIFYATSYAPSSHTASSPMKCYFYHRANFAVVWEDEIGLCHFKYFGLPTGISSSTAASRLLAFSNIEGLIWRWCLHHYGGISTTIKLYSEWRALLLTSSTCRYFNMHDGGTILNYAMALGEARNGEMIFHILAWPFAPILGILHIH